MPPTKYKVKQQVLSDFAATIDAKPNLSQEEIFQKFPEFNNDASFLKSAVDYAATSKSGKYKTADEINSKFPEFDFDNSQPIPSVEKKSPSEPASSVGVPQSDNGLQPSQSGETVKPAMVAFPDKPQQFDTPINNVLPDISDPYESKLLNSDKLLSLAPELHKSISDAHVLANQDPIVTDSKGNIVPFATDKSGIKNSVNAAASDIDRFADNLVGKHTDNGFVDANNQPLTQFKVGDIVSVPKDQKLDDGNMYPSGFAQLVQGADGSQRWRMTTPPNPSFVEPQKPIGNANITAFKGVPQNDKIQINDVYKEIGENRWGEPVSGSDPYWQDKPELRNYAKMAASDNDAKQIPFFLKQHQDIAATLEKDISASPHQTESQQGQYSLLTNAVIKKYSLDKNPLETDVATYDVPKFVKSLGDLAKDPNDKDAIAYLSTPENKKVLVKLKSYNKGQQILDGIPKLFPKMGEAEQKEFDDSLSTNDSFYQKYLANPVKSFYNGAIGAILKTGQAVGDVGNAIGLDATGNKDNISKQSRESQFNNVLDSANLNTKKYAENDPYTGETNYGNIVANFTSEGANMVGSIVPTMIAGGAGKIAMATRALMFAAPAYEDNLKEYRAAGIPEESSQLMAGINAAMMGVLGAGLGSPVEADGFKISNNAMQMALNPETKDAAAKQIASDFMDYAKSKGGDIFKGTTKATLEMQAIGVVNAAMNTLANNKYKTSLNEDVPDIKSMIHNWIMFGLQQGGMGGLTFAREKSQISKESYQQKLVYDAAKNSPTDAIAQIDGALSALDADSPLRAELEANRAKVEQFANAKFPKTMDAAQKTIAFQLNDEIKAKQAEIGSVDEAYQTPLKAELKELQTKLDNVVSNPIVARAELSKGQGEVKEILNPQEVEQKPQESTVEATEKPQESAMVASEEREQPISVIKAEDNVPRETTTIAPKEPEKVEKPTISIILPKPIVEHIDNGIIEEKAAHDFLNNDKNEQQDEPIISDIERQAASDDEASLHAAIETADKLIGKSGEPSENPIEATATEGQPSGEPIKEQKPTSLKEPVGITREVMNSEKIDSHLSDAENLFIGSSDNKAWEKTKAKLQDNPNLYQDRVSETFGDALKGETPRISDDDALIGLHEKVRLRIVHNDISQKIADAKSNGYNLSTIPLELERESIENKQVENKQFIKLVGSSSGKLLRSIGFLSGEDFSFAGLTHEIEREQGSKLTREQRDKFRKISEDHELLLKQMNDLHEKIKTDEQTRQQNQETERKKFEDDTIARIKKESGAKNNGTFEKKAAQLADKFRDKLKSRPLVFTDSEGNEIHVTTQGFSINDIVEIGAKAIELTGKIADGIKAIADHLKDQEWYKSLTKENKDAVDNQIKDYFKPDFDTLAAKAIEKSGGELHEGMKGTIDKMLRAVVEENPEITHTEATDKIYEALKEGIPNIGRNDVRDLISGYGKYKLLDKDQVPTAIREIKTQNRLDAALDAVKEKGELPLRSGMERHIKTEYARIKEAEILRTIKEKGLTPDLSAEDIDNQYKSAEGSYQKRLENAIEDVQREIDKEKLKERSSPKEYNSDRTKQLEADLKRLKEIRDTKPNIISERKESKESAKEKVTQKSINEIQKEIDSLKNGDIPMEDPTVRTKDGKQVYDFKKKQADKITNDRIKELEALKQNLQDEKSKLIPDEIKKQAIILKERANRQRRFESLEKQVKENNYSPKPKPEPKPYDSQVEETNLKIKRLESVVANEKEKIRLANRGKVEKTIESLSKYQRFMIFLNPWGMGRLAYAAMFRPITKVPTELAKYALSKLPVTSRIMEKSPSMYRPSIGSTGRAIKNYYSALISKKTFKDAASEYNKRSNYSLLHDDKGEDRYNTKAGFILAAPEMTHGFMKAFPKIAANESAYKAALENLGNSTDPKTGSPYDITDPRVRQIAMEDATRDAYADVFMTRSDLSQITNKMLSGLATSENMALQVAGLYGKQLEPVVKVPANFYHEVLQQIPIIGMLDAAQIIARSGEKGASKFKNGSYRGIDNLTPEQAHKAARSIVNQAMGLMFVGIGVALFKKDGKDVVKKVEEYKYWIHNSGLPLLMMGFNIGADLKHGDGVTAAVTKSSVHTIVEETTKLPQFKAAAQVAETGWAAAKAAAGKTTWAKASKPAQEMLAALLVPAGAAELAKRLDNAKKRHPKTFMEIVKMRIPGLRETIKH